MSAVTYSANGKRRSADAGTTVADLLAAAKLEPMQVFVEFNGEPLERERFGTTTLAEGDAIEIAQMVGGG
jgi:thiamine biosynthesis protein ThiS